MQSEKIKADGNLLTLSARALHALTMRKKLARTGQCKPISKRVRQSYRQDVTGYYRTGWSLIWQNLPEANDTSCNQSILSYGNISVESVLTRIEQEAIKVQKKFRRMTSGQCFQSGGKFASSAKRRLRKRFKHSMRKFMTSLTAFPNIIMSCS